MPWDFFHESHDLWVDFSFGLRFLQLPQFRNADLVPEIKMQKNLIKETAGSEISQVKLK